MALVEKETMGIMKNLISLTKERITMLKVTTVSLEMEVMAIRKPILTFLEVILPRGMTETTVITTMIISFPSEEVVNQSPRMTIHSVSFN